MASISELSPASQYYQLNSEKCTLSISGSVALEVYSNSKPYNLKIGKLQKGLIFVVDGVERVGEGTGFGFPILMYPKETYFSGSAEVWVRHTHGCIQVKKEFLMDRISRNMFGNVCLENPQARSFIRFLTDLYQKNRRCRYLSLKELIVNMGVKSTFIAASAIGKIPVTYTINGCNVDVEVDFRQIKKSSLKGIFVLNEQSAKHFLKYIDSDGTSLLDKQIGAWDVVDAESACLVDQTGQIGYRLWNIDGCILRRGRETMRDCLDWSGLDYEIESQRDVLNYRIEVLGGKP